MFLYYEVRVASGPRVASCKSALNPTVVYSADRSKAVVPVLVLLFVALWFILRGDLFYVLTLCYFVLVLFSHFRELILVFFVRLFDLCLVLSVSSSSCCQERAAICDFGTPYSYLFTFN